MRGVHEAAVRRPSIAHEHAREVFAEDRGGLPKPATGPNRIDRRVGGGERPSGGDAGLARAGHTSHTRRCARETRARRDGRRADLPGTARRRASRARRPHSRDTRRAARRRGSHRSVGARGACRGARRSPPRAGPADTAGALAMGLGERRGLPEAGPPRRIELMLELLVPTLQAITFVLRTSQRLAQPHDLCDQDVAVIRRRRARLGHAPVMPEPCNLCKHGTLDRPRSPAQTR